MAKGHWLDPLARSLLQATGRLPRPAAAANPSGAEARREASQPADTWLSEASDDQEPIEQDLLALKLLQNPTRPLENAEEVRRAAALGWRLDVNRATAADWSRLPGCRAEQIDLLLRLQAGGVQLSGPDDLQRLLDLDPSTLASWLPLLSFQWYGSLQPSPDMTRIAINHADTDTLTSQLNLEPSRLERLLKERRRSPFLDLADLQQRLQLPPSVVEAWIGKVSFEAGRSGPEGPTLPWSGRR